MAGRLISETFNLEESRNFTTIHLFAGIGDRHGPNEVFCVFQVLSENLKRCKGVLLCFYAENGVEFLIVFVQLL